jgi:hypothetical protein
MKDEEPDQYSVDPYRNEPSKEEKDFIAAFLDRQLYIFDSVNINDFRKANIISLVARARSIECTVADLLSPDGGNYQSLIEYLNKRVRLEERLSLFLNKSSIDINREQYRPLAPKNSADKLIHNPKYGYNLYDLDEYLIRLESFPTVKRVPASLQKNLIWCQFVETTEILVDYLAFLINFPVDSHKKKVDTFYNQHSKNETTNNKCRLVFLLRDTLLLYLGARRLQLAGMNIDIKAAMISRALVQSFTPESPNNSIYRGLYKSIFNCLGEYRGIYSSEFMNHYKELVLETKSEPITNLLHFIERYIKRLCGQEFDFIAVDTAAHGTMPLLTMIASNTVKKFHLYTGVPWLQNFYSEVIYRPDFPNMRILESLVCQEELFRFSSTLGDRVLIEETRDPIILSHASFEIGYFLNLVDSKFLK